MKTSQHSTSTPNQESDVGPLATAVGVQFVKNEETQVLCLPHERALLRARKYELEHHVVGEQDVRRVGRDPCPLLFLLLAGVAREGDRLAALAVALGEELP